MANVKSEKITTFGGIYYASKAFYALSLDTVINGTLGVRSSTYNGYQWDEIMSAMSDVFLCGGDCVEDVNPSGWHTVKGFQTASFIRLAHRHLPCRLRFLFGRYHKDCWRQLPHILHTGHTQCVNVQPHTRHTRMEACWDRLAGNGSGLGHVNTVHGRFPLPPYAPNGQDMRMRTIKIQIFDGKTLSAKLRYYIVSHQRA